MRILKHLIVAGSLGLFWGSIANAQSSENPEKFYYNELNKQLEQVERIIVESKKWTDTARDDVSGNYCETGEVSLSWAKIQHQRAYSGSDVVSGLERVNTRIPIMLWAIGYEEKKAKLRLRYDELFDEYTLLQRRIAALTKEITQKCGGETLAIIEILKAMLDDPNIPESVKEEIRKLLDRYEKAAKTGNKGAIEQLNREAGGLINGSGYSMGGDTLSNILDQYGVDRPNSASDVDDLVRKMSEKGASRETIEATLRGIANDPNASPDARRRAQQLLDDMNELNRIVQGGGSNQGSNNNRGSNDNNNNNNSSSYSDPNNWGAGIQSGDLRIRDRNGNDITDVIGQYILEGKSPTTIDKKYSGPENTFLILERKREAKLAISPDNPNVLEVVDESIVDEREFDFSIQRIDDGSGVSGGIYTAKFELVNLEPTGSDIYSIDRWTADSNGAELIGSESNKAIFQFTESGTYVITASGTTDWGSRFRIEAEMEITLNN